MSLVERADRPTCSKDPDDVNRSIETLVQKMKNKIDTFSDKLDELNNKVLYLEHNLVSIKQNQELCNAAH